MIQFKKPLILIGFKHAGKSVIGSALAQTLKVDYLDLDLQLEYSHSLVTGANLTCRQIAQQAGLDFFRNLEAKTLECVMKSPPTILSVGGGTPLLPKNRELIKQGTVVWIKAPKGRVFERIMIHGRPAFFPEGEEAYDAFIRTWEEREPIYSELAQYSIDNLGTVEQAVHSILTLFREEVIYEA